MSESVDSNEPVREVTPYVVESSTVAKRALPASNTRLRFLPILKVYSLFE